MAKQKDQVVFVNGVFDIVHPGHIELLKFARSLGSKLVVGINSDRVVRLQKGKGRPVNNELKRKKFLESIKWVDEVVIFDDAKTGNTVRKVGADVVVRGESGRSDAETRKIDDLPPHVKIARMPKVGNFSTTNVIVKDVLKGFDTKRVLLVGDAILDVYIHGVATGQGLGTTVPRVLEESTEISFGGNGLIAKNILELGGQVSFVSVVGADSEASIYNSLKHKKLTKHFTVDKSRPTTVKRRIFADGTRLLHLNRADNRPLDKKIEARVISSMRPLAKMADVIVIMDPQHGLLTQAVVKEAISLGRRHSMPVYIDTQVSHQKSNHHIYKGAHTMFLNENEAKAVYPKFDISEGKNSLLAIKKALKLKNVIVKLGQQGSVALIDGEYIKTLSAKVIALDPVGAGDAFLSAYSLGDENHPKETLFIANSWAALSTTIPGTTPAKKKDLLKMLR